MSTLRRVCRHGRRRPDRGHRWTACSSLREEGGQALVEFALLLPFLVGILLAIVKFGIAVNNQDVLTNAVRVGSRTLAISRGDSDPCGKTARSIVSSASDLDPAKLVTQLFVSTAPDGNTYVNCSSSGVLSGYNAKVTAKYPCDLVVVGVNFMPGCSLSTTTVVRIE